MFGFQASFKGFWGGLKDLCFPPACLSCNTPLPPHQDLFFCETCAKQIDPIMGPLCSQCGKAFPNSAGDNHLCSTCLKQKWHFTTARALVHYKKPVPRAIQSFKYNGNTSGLASFGKLKNNHLWFNDIFAPDIIVPVPLHIKRLRERGFNQALLLARAFFPQQKNRIDATLLERTKKTKPQTNMSGAERRKNLKNAFRVNNRTVLSKKKVLLVDDVFTTGSTVNECARTLLRAGAKEVQVLTLARVEN